MATPNAQVNPDVLLQYEYLVRSYLQDYSENNKLLPDEQEYSTGLINQNILMALDLYNKTIGYITDDTLENFPVPTLLVIGAAALCLVSGGVLQTRNHFSISDGALGGPLSEKSEYYRSWGNTLMELFTKFATKYKDSRNSEGGYSSISSSYLCAYADRMRGK